MKKILQYLFEHKTLSRAMAKEVLVNIGKGVYNEHEVTAFMTLSSPRFQVKVHQNIKVSITTVSPIHAQAGTPCAGLA